MALIKNQSAAPLLRDALVLDLGDLNRQAERIIADAQAEARRITEQAQREAKTLVAGAEERGHAQGLERGLVEGREQGRAEGREEALQQGQAQLDGLQQQWQTALEEWEAAKRDLLLSAKEDVLAFACAIAEKVVYRISEDDRSVAVDQVAEALALLSRASTVRIAVHPSDRELVERVLPAVLAQLRAAEQATLEADASIQPGGCVLRTGSGMIDARLETQLDRIAEALLPPARRWRAIAGAMSASVVEEETDFDGAPSSDDLDGTESA